MKNIVDDEFFYTYIPQIEQKILDRIPPENEIQHQFSNRFKRKMKTLLKYERRTPAMRRFVQWTKNTAVILFVIVSLSFGTVLSVEAYRIRFFEFITEVWYDLTSIVIRSNDNALNDTLIPVTPSFIPEGYEILEQSTSKYENIIIYNNENGAEIYFSQELLTQSEFIIDSENAVIETFTIGAQDIYMIINKNITQLYWHDDTTIFSIIGSFDRTELIKIAESIIYN